MKVAAADEITNWRSGPEECQNQRPTILSMLQRRLRSVELLLGLCQPECPSMTDLGSNVKYFQAKAQEDLDKMKLAVDDWAKNSEAPPFPQYLEMGVFLNILLAVQLLGYGKADYDKAQLEADVSNVKTKLSHCGTLLKRVKNSIDKSKKAKEEHRKMLEKLAEKAGKDVEKQAQVMKRKAEQEQRRIDKAVTKVGHVSSLYDMDILKLGGSKIHVYTTDDFLDMTKESKVDMSLPWCLKCDLSKLPSTEKILKAVEVTKSLATYEAGFPGSASATRGKKRSQSAVNVEPALRKSCLAELGVEEAIVEGIHADTTKTFIWAFGEDYAAKGTEMHQMASLRLQTSGCRSVICCSSVDLLSYLQIVLDKSDVTLADVGKFLEGMQAAECAEFLKRKPGSLCKATVTEGMAMYLPCGWLLFDKTLNMKCVFGIRMSFLPDKLAEGVLTRICGFSPRRSRLAKVTLRKWST